MKLKSILILTGLAWAVTLPPALSTSCSCGGENPPISSHKGYIILNNGRKAYFDDFEESGLCSNFKNITIENIVYTREEFNFPIVIDNDVKEIPKYFLSSCPNFDKPITLPNNLINIGENFLSYCDSFNQSLVLPNSLESIDGWFLANSDKFNKDLILPSSLKWIGNNFLEHCTKFNKPITLPDEHYLEIGYGFLSDCDEMTSQVNIKTLPASRFDNNYSDTLATNNKSAPMYVTGVEIIGTYKTEFLTRFPARKTTAPYRNLK